VIGFRLVGRGMEEQREAVKAAYLMLREHYPGLPEQLRDFQVASRRHVHVKGWWGWIKSSII